MAVDVRAPEHPRVRRLEVLWEERPGLIGWLTTVDHKRIGILYLFTTLAFFGAGGIEALLIRTQLAGPHEHLVGPDTFNQLFTTHGVTMIFLFVIPMTTGAFGNYLVPLMIGSRDMAFPRLNALSYWLFLSSGLFIYAGLFMGAGPNSGWFDYVPLALKHYNPGPNVDFYALGLILNGISSTIASINFITTIFKLRAPGMSLNRMPLFCFAMLAVSLALIFALPALTLDLVMLELERKLGFQFFNPAHGGDPLLWQHLFWFFGHPEVYIIVLPAFGIATSIIPTFAKRKMLAFPLVALAELLVAFIGFGVWAHHMFATGLPEVTLIFFAAASMMVVIPSTIQVFAWTLTVNAGKPEFRAPLLFIGGLHRLLRARRAVRDHVRRDPVRPGDDRHVLRRRALPLHHLRRRGLPDPRRPLLLVPEGHRPHVPRGLGQGLVLAHLRGDVADVLPDAPRRAARDAAPRLHLRAGPRLGRVQPERDDRRLPAGGGTGDDPGQPGRRAASEARSPGPDPFHGGTLEWTVPSPPPHYNFAVIPTVSSAYPNWDEDDRRTDARKLELGEMTFESGHETPTSSVRDGIFDEVVDMPSDSWWPILVAASAALMFTMVLISHYAVAGFCLIPLLLCLIGWHTQEPQPEG